MLEGAGWGAGTGRDTPALPAVLDGEDELHVTEPGVWWEGDEAGAAKLGRWDPPQSPASFSSNVSPLVAFSAVLEAFFFFFF